MDIQSAAVASNQAMVQEEAAMRVEAMSIDAMREQAAALDKVMDSAQVITDPVQGQALDVTA